MHVTFKTTIWEKVDIPEELEKEISEKIRKGEITSTEELIREYPDDCSMEELYDTSYQLLPEENNGDSTICLYDNGELIYENQSKLEEIRTWDFVEKYYPNYYQCDEIARNSDLNKIVDQDYEQGSEAESLFANELESSMSRAITEFAKSEAYVYQKAIEGYIQQTKNI